MKRMLIAAVAVAGLGLATVSAQTPGPWKVLFDGKDLSQWTIPAQPARNGAPAQDPNAAPGWHLENGVVVGGQNKPGERSGALTTNEKFFDFELELEFNLAELPGKCTEAKDDKQVSLSDHDCILNSGINWRIGYQLNLGRREASEYIGLVIHRPDPKALPGNVLWLSWGDKDHPTLRKHNDWNAVRVAVKGDHMQAWLNGTKIVDVMDKSTIPEEATWRVPQPVSLQMPYIAGGFAKFRNIRIRTL